MTDIYYQTHAKHVANILAHLPKQSSKLLIAFTRQFYGKVHISDLEQLDPSHAVALAACAFTFFEKRKGSAPAIRIFSPTRKEHGYESRNLIIEILNDDRPFLVDSLSAELTRQGFTIRETFHPILHVARDAKGVLRSIAESTTDFKDTQAESLIHFEISGLPEQISLEQLRADLEWVLQYIACAVEDWQSIVDKATMHIESLPRNATFFDKQLLSEAQAFLSWLVNRNFVFLGYAEYNFFDEKGREKLSAVPGSKLGILKISSDTTFRGLESLSTELRHLVLVPTPIEITKTMRRSPVHRPVPMDCIGIKRFNAKGEVIGEARFLGLFTSTVYYQSSEQIPFLRHKIARIMRRSDFEPSSHDGKALKAIMEFLPRDEVFQMSEDNLLETGLGILALEAKPAVRIFARPDAFERFVSLMIFVPRERFSTDLRHQIESLMEQAFSGSVSTFSTQITEAPLARLHLIIKTTQGEIPHVNIASLEAEIARRAYLWSDLLAEELERQHAESKAVSLSRLYADAFPKDYINRYDTAAAVYDIGKLEDARTKGALSLELFRPRSDPGERFVHLKIYSPQVEIALSDILPILENAGFRAIDEHPFRITPYTSAALWIRDFRLELPQGLTGDIKALKSLLEEALLAVWFGRMENDRFNALVLKAGLCWREVTMLRAYAKYLKQTPFPFDQASIEHALGQQPEIVRQIVALFHARFSPSQKQREAEEKKLLARIDEQLSQVKHVNEDRILRHYIDVIRTTWRTNYYQKDRVGNAKPVLSFKLNAREVPGLPLPRPYAEIFVYGTRVEGIHLRGGKVARGGLRWSDRHDDFRTEILGLMKAQMVKNSVIVPVGSKGGFVVKHPPQPGNRDALMEEGIACYRLYLSGLLDLTDNIVAGKIVPPPQLVRHDEDDPYLVVAADKGTASFSDIANSVSADYGFWLGDAFASGGSAGYDHKKMAITARGAWVSVVRHFQEMGVDIGTEPFSVVGIGDMSGDVFGNGMLLSKNIRLLAAFNHQHIFIDPTPDMASSFKERERLFNLPRSTWKEYDEKLISKGGGVYERSAKSIAVSKEAQNALGLNRSSYAPEELIRALLLAPVDLLWNGGIGTYVKAESETHEQVGDRANNAVRVNGRELRCKVVGEGGNLGFTQRGRIEYARMGCQGSGGRINTDAIDNSGGVDCSDHEVNIKIAFSGEISRGKLSASKRDKHLLEMTEEVARLVLKDNTLQTQALSVAERQGAALIDAYARLMHGLEREGMLDRSIEFLPTDAQLAELKAARKGLTRPELAVLLAYSKMKLYRELLDSSLPDEVYYTADLRRYFPKAMQQHFAPAIEQHPLKREIIATVVTNSMINRAGITFFSTISEDLGVSARDVAAAYTLARDVFSLREVWKSIESLPDKNIPQKAQMYAQVASFLQSVTRWVLRNLPLPLNIEQVAAEVAPGVTELGRSLEKIHSTASRERFVHTRDMLAQQGVPVDLATRMAALEVMASAFDIVAVAHKTNLNAVAVGKAYFTLGEQLHFGWLRESAGQIQAAGHWDRLAVQSVLAELFDEQRRLCLAVIESDSTIEAWLAKREAAISRYDVVITDIRGGDAPDMSKLLVALRYIREL